jgi:hypothetical protein
MATTTIWNIAQLERHAADAYGSVGLEQPDPDNIIPYANLTSGIVIGWVQDRLNVEEIEDSLQAQLDEKNAPTTATGLPWS